MSPVTNTACGRCLLSARIEASSTWVLNASCGRNVDVNGGPVRSRNGRLARAGLEEAVAVAVDERGLERRGGRGGGGSPVPARRDEQRGEREQERGPHSSLSPAT